jgi:hypothetical protein
MGGQVIFQQMIARHGDHRPGIVSGFHHRIQFFPHLRRIIKPNDMRVAKIPRYIQRHPLAAVDTIARRVFPEPEGVETLAGETERGSALLEMPVVFTLRNPCRRRSAT